MRWQGIWIGIAVVTLGAGAGALWANRLRLVTLKTQSMPGFDIDLPAHKPEPREVDYEKGRITLAGLMATRSLLQVTWEPGELFDDDLVQMSIKAFSRTYYREAQPIEIATPVAISGPGPTRSWAVRVGDQDTWATQIVCGARRVTVTTASSHRGVEPLHRRVARSIRCRPDPVKEQTVGDVPVVFDLVPGWFHLPGTIDNFQITDGHSILSSRFFLDTASRLADAERVLTTPGLFPGFKFGARVGDAWPIELTREGGALQGWVVVRPCPDSGRSLLLVSLNTDGGSDDKGRGLLARGRCRKANEPRQTWPELPREATEN